MTIKDPCAAAGYDGMRPSQYVYRIVVNASELRDEAKRHPSELDAPVPAVILAMPDSAQITQCRYAAHAVVAGPRPCISAVAYLDGNGHTYVRKASAPGKDACPTR